MTHGMKGKWHDKFLSEKLINYLNTKISDNCNILLYFLQIT